MQRKKDSQQTHNIMKKTIITCIFLVVAATLAAQTPAPVLHRECLNHHDIDHCIVRTDRITYFEEYGVGYFAYLNTFFGTFYSMKIPDKWSVRDFRVLDNTVYFCGTDTRSQTALLGHFDLSNLIAGSGNITIYHDANISNQLAILTRIAVGGKGTNVSIMAIGQKSPGGNPNLDGCDRVLYIENYLAGAGCIYGPKVTYPEQFWDVVATDKYFVMAGSEPLSPPTLNPDIYMHKVLIGTSTANFMTAFGHRHEYTCPMDDISGVRAVAIDKDSVVFASYHKFTNIYNYDDMGMLFITLDVPSGQMGFYQYYSLPGSNLPWPIIAPRDMVYMPRYKSLMVIDDLLGYIYPPSRATLMINPCPDPSIVPIFSYYGAPFIASKRFLKATSLSVDSAVCCLAAYDYISSSSGGGWTRLDLSSILPSYNIHCIETFMADMFVYPLWQTSTLVTGTIDSYKMDLITKLGVVNSETHDPQCTDKNE